MYDGAVGIIHRPVLKFLDLLLEGIAGGVAAFLCLVRTYFDLTGFTAVINCVVTAGLDFALNTRNFASAILVHNNFLSN